MIEFIFVVIAIIFVTTVHEFSHAYAATVLGDPTSKHMGRLTLNPLAHLDPLGLVLIFLVGIGWGKPVMVNPAYFKNPKLHEALTAVAGPMANLAIALVMVIPLKYFPNYLGDTLRTLFEVIFNISLVLFAFNMLPFPPLDGSKFIQIFIPKKFAPAYERYLASAGLYFMAFVIIDNLILARYFHFSILQHFVGTIYVFLKALIFLGS